MAKIVKSSSNKLNCEIPEKIKDAIVLKASKEGFSRTANYLNHMYDLYMIEPERFSLSSKDILKYLKYGKYARFAWRASEKNIKEIEYNATVNLRSLAAQAEYFIYRVYKNNCEK